MVQEYEYKLDAMPAVMLRLHGHDGEMAPRELI